MERKTGARYRAAVGGAAAAATSTVAIGGSAPPAPGSRRLNPLSKARRDLDNSTTTVDTFAPIGAAAGSSGRRGHRRSASLHPPTPAPPPPPHPVLAPLTGLLARFNPLAWVGAAVWALLSLLLMHVPRLVAALPGGVLVLRKVCTWTVRAIRFQLDTFWTGYQLHYWIFGRGHIAQDGQPVMAGVRSVTLERYGPHEREFCHILRPEHAGGGMATATARSLEEELASAAVSSASSLSSSQSSPSSSLPHDADSDPAPAAHSPPKASPVLVYVHGGGFVVANSCVLIASVTAFARHGMTVFSLEYPLAPEDAFPTAVVSILRALQWMRVEHGVERVVLLGDSAGASLATMAAAFICNKHLMHDLAEACGEAVHTWTYPHIDLQAAVYGLLDQRSWWGRRLPSIGPVENAVALTGLSLALELYRCEQGTLANRIVLLDLLEELEQFPRTLFVAAGCDPLIFSSQAAYAALQARGFDVHYAEYDARHGYFGVPPAWTRGGWKTASRPTFEMLMSFFNARDAQHACVATATEACCTTSM